MKKDLSEQIEQYQQQIQVFRRNKDEDKKLNEENKKQVSKELEVLRGELQQSNVKYAMECSRTSYTDKSSINRGYLT